MKIYMIRHGATKGNKEHRYIGSTDEGLLTEECAALMALQESYKNICSNCVYVRPMRRCRETAELLFPHARQLVVEEFRECDFGDFEYKNYEELNGNRDYQRFIDSGGRCGFPGGETRDEFQKRCVDGLLGVIGNCDENTLDIVMVVHGGTIMALLDRFSNPHGDYYDWQVRNGCGYVAEIESDKNGEICLVNMMMVSKALFTKS